MELEEVVVWYKRANMVNMNGHVCGESFAIVIWMRRRPISKGKFQAITRCANAVLLMRMVRYSLW